MMFRPRLTVALAIGLAAACLQAADDAAVLPLARHLAGDRQLPLPFGVGVNVYYQEQDYRLDDIRLDLPPAVDPRMLAELLPQVKVENELREVNLRLDAWVLPFLNVFGIVGYLDGTTDVRIGPPFGTLSIDYDGTVYGAGATAAWSVERLFASLTGLYTDSDLDVTGSSVTTWVAAPKVGYAVPGAAGLEYLGIYVGAMYQDTEEAHTGRITVPQLGSVGFDVKLQQEEAWNYLAGATLGFTERFAVEVEGGFGDRTHGAVQVTYRF